MMIFDCEYASAVEGAVTHLLRLYTNYYNDMHEQRMRGFKQELADLEARLAEAEGAPQRLIQRENEKNQASDDLDQAIEKCKKLRAAQQVIGNYWGILDPNAEEQRGLNMFSQASGYAVSVINSPGTRENIVEAAQGDIGTKQRALDNANFLHSQQQLETQNLLGKGLEFKQQIEDLKAHASVLGFQL